MRNMKKMEKKCISYICQQNNMLFYQFLLLSRVTLHIRLSQVAPEAGPANWRVLPAENCCKHWSHMALWQDSDTLLIP